MPSQTPSEPTVPRQRKGEPPTFGRRRAADLLPLEQVYSELGVARSTFYDWRAKGKAPKCIKLPNGELRVRRDVLDRWLNDLEQDAA
jgi:predicted DNA-binding transcriptional regulator AlpA